jgi:hypothetical protein
MHANVPQQMKTRSITAVHTDKCPSVGLLEQHPRLSGKTILLVCDPRPALFGKGLWVLDWIRLMMGN